MSLEHGNNLVPFDAALSAGNQVIHVGQGYVGDITIVDGGAAGGTIRLVRTKLAVGSSWATEPNHMKLLQVAAGVTDLPRVIHWNPWYYAVGLGLILSAADLEVVIHHSKLV